MTPSRTAEIHYARLPDRLSVFRQPIVHEAPEFTVTFLAAADLPRPVMVDGRPILEPGAPAIWFTFPGRWYDIGRFHLADGSFTGFYGNILTPVQMVGDVWHTTDLCLDVWYGSGGKVRILDRDEFGEAVERGWMGPETASTAEAAAADLADQAREGRWPSSDVREWTLERVTRLLRREDGSPP